MRQVGSTFSWCGWRSPFDGSGVPRYGPTFRLHPVGASAQRMAPYSRSLQNRESLNREFGDVTKDPRMGTMDYLIHGNSATLGDALIRGS